MKNAMERENTVDIAKGIGIISVIIGHLNHFFAYEDLVPIIIYSFHMPLFIILSGYVFNYHPEASAKEYCYKRFSQIMKPYFMFAAITFLYDNARRGWDADGVYGIFIGNGIDNHLNFNIALWFLPMLFLCNIVFWCIVRLSKYIDKMWISQVMLILLSFFLTGVGYGMIMHQKRLPWGIETALFSQIFMLIGYTFKMVKNKYSVDRKNKKTILCICPIIAAIWWIGVKINGRVDMNAGRYGNVWCFFIVAICGFYLVWQISYLISKIHIANKILSVLGRDSLYIMAYHIPASYLVYNVILPYMPNIVKENAWKPNVIGILYVCIGDILVALFMKMLHTSAQSRETK